MEFSVSKAINNLRPSITKLPYARSTSFPSKNVIIPGIAHSSKPPHSSQIVSLSSATRHQGNFISKKLEKEETDVQTGGGKKEESDLAKNLKLDSVLLHSMKHPRMIETSSVTFERSKPLKQKPKDKQGSGEVSTAKKPKLTTKSNMKHKFSFL